MAVPQFPAVVPPFSVFAVLTDGVGDGRMEVKVTRLENDEQVAGTRRSLHFGNKLTKLSCHFRFRQCSFPAPGYDQFTLLVDGEWVAQRRLHVYRREDES